MKSDIRRFKAIAPMQSALLVYFATLGSTYVSIWSLLEPLAVPEFVVIANIEISRIVLHVFLSFFLAAHVTIVYLSILRPSRQESASLTILSELRREQALLLEELKGNVSSLEEELKSQRTSLLRNELTRGLENPAKTINELSELNKHLHKFSTILAETTDLDPPTGWDTLVINEKRTKLVSLILEAVFIVFFYIAFALVSQLVYLLLPEPLRSILSFLLFSLGVVNITIFLIVLGFWISTLKWFRD